MDFQPSCGSFPPPSNFLILCTMDSCDCFALETYVEGVLSEGYAEGSDGDVLGESEGTALIDGG